MGEARKRAVKAVTERTEPMVVDTPGGRIHVQWDQESSATPNGQLTFFAEFLHTAGLYEAWVQDCPLSYTSPNLCTHLAIMHTRPMTTGGTEMETAQHLMEKGLYDVGDFGDARLKKTARFCCSAWYPSRLSVCGNWRETGRGKCSLVAGWRMTK